MLFQEYPPSISWRGDRRGYVTSVYTAPEYRGRGIGTAMMQCMLRHLRAAGYRRASLAVQKENYAVRMYRALGFRTVRETDEEYIMVIDLA